MKTFVLALTRRLCKSSENFHASHSKAVFEVPVAYHWLARKEALAVAIRHVHGLALSHHVTDGCRIVIG
jgi:hypothetical protein